MISRVEYIKAILKQTTANEKNYLKQLQDIFSDDSQYEKAISEASSDKLHKIFVKYPEKLLANSSEQQKVYVDRLKARYSTWYEFFPRSAAKEEGVHGTFKDCERLLPRVAERSAGKKILVALPFATFSRDSRYLIAIKSFVGSPLWIASKTFWGCNPAFFANTRASPTAAILVATMI